MINEIIKSNFIKITLSSPLSGAEFEKITARPIVIKGKGGFQAERFKENKVFHLNLDQTAFEAWLEEVTPFYKQICLFLAGKTVTYFINKEKI